MKIKNVYNLEYLQATKKEKDIEEGY